MNRRIAAATLGSAAVMLIVFAEAGQHTPLLIWNASTSVPVGLYAVHEAAPLAVGELVVVQPPEPIAKMLADGGYLPRGVPLLKHVAALPGSTVCRRGLAVSIDGVLRAQARPRDHAGRSLPSWSGCRAVTDGEVFLLNATEPASLDGRYFGPIPSKGIVGKAIPVWTERQP